MKDVFVSIRGRVLLNAESLNMTESVGNYSKHRRVPVVLREEEGSYSVYFVPAISGESIAHGLQQIISEKCKESNPPLPVCKLCGKGIFLKSSNAQIFKESFDLEASNQDVEKIIISKCTVEDIGGFLYAEKANVKRTSNFITGYMIPTQEALKNDVIEPQLHSRYALGTKFVEDKGQMLYYVEVSSSVYTFSLDLDTRYVGKLTFNIENAGKPVISDDERERRILVLLDAVKALLIENGFGAKKTRFLPIVDWESMVIAASDKPWSVPSPITRNYVERARKKLEKVSYNTNLYVFEGGNFEAFVADTMDKIKLRVKGAT